MFALWECPQNLWRIWWCELCDPKNRPKIFFVAHFVLSFEVVVGRNPFQRGNFPQRKYWSIIYSRSSWSLLSLALSMQGKRKSNQTFLLLHLNIRQYLALILSHHSQNYKPLQSLQTFPQVPSGKLTSTRVVQRCVRNNICNIWFFRRLI